MRVCLLGDYYGYPDEAMKKVAARLAEGLSKRHSVQRLNIKDIFWPRFWREIRGFDAHIIHYVPGPTIISFMILYTLGLCCKQAKTVMSAMHPGFHGLRGFAYGPSYALSAALKCLVRPLRPDVILTQSKESERFFEDLGCTTRFLPSGVDTERFAPAPTELSETLRQKYGLAKDDFVCLHVGSVKKTRNLQILARLQEAGNQVIVVGSTHAGKDEKICEYLREKACKVWIEYFENVEELYMVSDCYVFPTLEKVGCIEMPLSVLEAMACNLPVVSTRFAALPRVFEEGKGLIFAEGEEEFLRAVQEVKDSSSETRTRDKVLPYSWDNIIRSLEEIYGELLESHQRL